MIIKVRNSLAGKYPKVSGNIGRIKANKKTEMVNKVVQEKIELKIFFFMCLY